jgi:RNA polymerase sigma-70 factor, ECF subfamily
VAGRRPRLAGASFPPGSDERLLVLRALTGDRSAERALYDRYRSAVFRVARSFAELDHDDVADVVQESFVRGLRNLAGLKDPGRFGPWLLAIVRNRALTQLAKKQAASQIFEKLEDAAAEAGEGPEAFEPDAEAELELVRRTIAELPEGPEKETVRLFYLEGELSAREIAEKLGVGKSAITMRLERFRAKVKRKLLSEVAKLRGDEST